MSGEWSYSEGMSLRDYFAAAALPAAMNLLQDARPKEGESWDEMIARHSYEAADAMLKESNKVH